jgi:DNA primase
MNRNQKRSIHLCSTSTVNLVVKPELPGTIIPLHNLEYDHHANVYLRQRGYDTQELGKYLDVGWCVEAKPQFKTAENRIIIPAYMHEELRGWQARYVGDRNWKICKTPKYYTMPHMQKGEILYNFDYARNNDFIILTEGPSDVWAVGPEAIALWGKSASAKQIESINQHWDKIVILLDGDAWEEIDGLMEIFKHKEVVPIYLEPGDDPGSFDRSYIWDIIESATRQKGMVLDD